jgi:RsiW-degrading membrane proteinase PrsW (M82 family)
MPIIVSLFAAIAPMLIYMLLIWWMDRYDREPMLFVFFHFLWGAFGAVILGISGSIILATLTGMLGQASYFSSLVQTIIFAPFSEEVAKGSFLLFTINSRKFDNITDGLVYGAAIGLGFGMTENFIYLLTYGNSPESWFQIVMIRSLFSAVMHCIATGSFGALLAISKFSSPFVKNSLPFLGLTLAIFIHFSWNTFVSFQDTYFYGFLFMLFLVLVFFFVFKLSINNEKKIIERELLEESKMNLIPPKHIKILSSHLRFRSGWVDENIRIHYSRFAIRLAFCKNQYKRVKDSSKDYYALEIEKNREAVRSLLSTN